MWILFTNKSTRKTLLSSLMQQRAGLTMMQPMILCPRHSRVCMYFNHQTGLIAANNLGQSWSAASSNPSIVGPSALLQSSTGNNHCSSGDPPPESSPVAPPHSSFPSTTTNGSAKCKHSAHQSVCSLPIFANTNANNFMSVSDAEVFSHSQTGTNSKWQKVNGPSALLSTSEELKDFNNTIKDLSKSKEVNKRQEQQEQASSSEHWMKVMTALQEQESSWMTLII